MARTDIVDLAPRRAVRGGYTLTERTYLDVDGKATTDRTRGVTLLGPAGRTIPIATARLAGLEKAEKTAPAERSDPAVKIPGSAEEEAAKVIDKPKRRARTADKSRKAEGDK